MRKQPYPTQTHNSGRAEQCLVVQRWVRWNRGGCTPLGSRFSAKWTRPSYQIFFGERFLSVPMIPNRKKTKNEEYGAPPLMGYPPQMEINRVGGVQLLESLSPKSLDESMSTIILNRLGLTEI